MFPSGLKRYTWYEKKLYRLGENWFKIFRREVSQLATRNPVHMLVNKHMTGHEWEQETTHKGASQWLWWAEALGCRTSIASNKWPYLCSWMCCHIWCIFLTSIGITENEVTCQSEKHTCLFPSRVGLLIMITLSTNALSDFPILVRPLSNSGAKTEKWSLGDRIHW